MSCTPHSTPFSPASVSSGQASLDNPDMDLNLHGPHLSKQGTLKNHVSLFYPHSVSQDPLYFSCTPPAPELPSVLHLPLLQHLFLLKRLHLHLPLL